MTGAIEPRPRGVGEGIGGESSSSGGAHVSVDRRVHHRICDDIGGEDGKARGEAKLYRGQMTFTRCDYVQCSSEIPTQCHVTHMN